MKKILFVAITFFMLNSVFAKYPVLARTTNNGGIFGYNRTKSEASTFVVGDATVTGYAVSCFDPGLTSCPKLGSYYRPTGGVNEDGWDKVQVDKTDYLAGYALAQIANNNLEGIYTIQVQVQGEPKTRLYEVIWHATDKEALNSTITVNRDDI